MRSPLLITFLMVIATGTVLAQDKPTAMNKDQEALYTTTKELKERYQKVNASIFAILMEPTYYRGPHAGPGIILGYDGPLLRIEWLSKDKDERIFRQIPFRAITSIDKPIDRKGKLDYYVVYYTGPWGET